MGQVGMPRQDANGIAVLAAAKAGDFSVEPVGAVFEVLVAFHHLMMAFDEAAVGIDPTVIKLDGHVFRLDLTQMHSGFDTDPGSDRHFDCIVGLDLLDPYVVPGVRKPAFPMGQ